MKNIIVLFYLISSGILSAQLKPNINLNLNTKEKQYVYRVKLLSIQNVSYPNIEIQLKLIPRAALYNSQDMISPKQSSLNQVCPNFLYGFSLIQASANNNCDTKLKSTLIFKDKLNMSDTFSLKVNQKEITSESKLTLGLYGAEMMLPNGQKKRIDKVIMRSFHLSDFDYSVRNYIKYEFQIEGATFILDYLIERGTVN